MSIRYSIIIPVFNRPDELKELLESMLKWKNREAGKTGWRRDTEPEQGAELKRDTVQEKGTAPGRDHEQKQLQIQFEGNDEDPGSNWEVIVVEDGSGLRSEDVCRQYSRMLDISYVYQENAGPAAARNTGSRKARGDWLIFFDSDCIIPEGYFDAVDEALRDESIDYFGGPDRASADFSAVQRAIDYAMTSFLTTGGIRGGRRKLDRYYPRSFNMGVRKAAFEDVAGFSGLRFGEDLDLSMRLMMAGYRSVLIEDAWVYHKRRTNFKKFFKQVYNSGMARVVLNRLHPGTLKMVHLLPSFFVLYILAALISLIVIPHPIFWYPVGILILILFIDGFRSTGSLAVSVLVPLAGIVQLSGYGTGLIHAWILVHILGRNKVSAFEKTFYK